MQNDFIIANLEKKLSRERILRQISNLFISDLAIKDVSLQVAEVIGKYLNASRCLFHDYDESGLTKFVSEYCSEGTKSFTVESDDIRKDLVSYIDHQNAFYYKFKVNGQNNAIFTTLDTLNSEEFEPIYDICKEYEIFSQASVKIVLNAKVIGGVYLHFNNEAYPEKDDLVLLEVIANEYLMAIDRAFSADKLLFSNSKLIDITLELKKSLKEEKKMRSMQIELIAMISHEFKTPLQIIDSTRELISRKIQHFGIVDESLSKYFVRLQNSVERMSELIQSSLNLSKIEMMGDDLKLEKVDCDLKYLIKDILEKNSNLSTQKALKIVTDIENLPIFNGDYKLLEHSFTNVITNAFKYSREKTSVRISSTIDGDNIIIEVSDQGIGIPKGDIKNIGNKFFRAKNTLDIAGTGIGIYSTKYFINLHKGSFVIDSKINVGTTVKITLPMTVQL